MHSALHFLVAMLSHISIRCVELKALPSCSFSTDTDKTCFESTVQVLLDAKVNQFKDEITQISTEATQVGDSSSLKAFVQSIGISGAAKEIRECCTSGEAQPSQMKRVSFQFL